jgi:hypothetical protein
MKSLRCSSLRGKTTTHEVRSARNPSKLLVSTLPIKCLSPRAFIAKASIESSLELCARTEVFSYDSATRLGL